MPYKTKAERARASWKTIPEVVDDIRAADHCNQRAARDNLRKALTDDGLWPLRWQPEEGDRTPQKYHGIPLAAPDDLPPRGRVWSEAKIRWKSGRVQDDWGDYNNGKWRVLLIHHLIVAQYWKPPAPSNRPLDPGSNNVVPLYHRRRGPKPDVGNKIKDSMRKDIRDRELTIQGLRDMTEEALGARYGASRDTCRKARKTVLSESESVENTPDRNSDK